MKLIPLTQGQFAQVDDDDFELLNQWRWFADKNKKTYYAKRHVPGNHKKFIRMHNQIMNPLPGFEIDHIDHNGINNQRSNLRNCTHAQNHMNVIPCGNSGYLGVYTMKGKTHKGKKYRDYIMAHIRVNKKLIHLGHFDTLELAARAYDNAAQKYFGEFANLNFKA